MFQRRRQGMTWPAGAKGMGVVAGRGARCYSQGSPTQSPFSLPGSTQGHLETTPVSQLSSLLVGFSLFLSLLISLPPSSSRWAIFSFPLHYLELRNVVTLYCKGNIAYHCVQGEEDMGLGEQSIASSTLQCRLKKKGKGSGAHPKQLQVQAMPLTGPVDWDVT